MNFTLKECGMQDCTEEDLKLHLALAMDPFLKFIGEPCWLGKSREQIIEWINSHKVKAAAWACTESKFTEK